jgi:hypothetical protein
MSLGVVATAAAVPNSHRIQLRAVPQERASPRVSGWRQPRLVQSALQRQYLPIAREVHALTVRSIPVPLSGSLKDRGPLLDARIGAAIQFQRRNPVHLIPVGDTAIRPCLGFEGLAPHEAGPRC